MNEEHNKATYVTQKLDSGNAQPISVNNQPKIVKTVITTKQEDIYRTVEVRKYNKKVVIGLIIALILILVIFFIFELPMITGK